MVERFLSEPLELPPLPLDSARVDLIFYGVDHSGPSFEARVFLNAPAADVSTGRDDESYAGSFYVFGHGGCFGDVGHCDLPGPSADPFDRRPAHQLTRQIKAVTVTETLRRRIDLRTDAQIVRATVIAETLGQSSNEVLVFETLRLVVYA